MCQTRSVFIIPVHPAQGQGHSKKDLEQVGRTSYKRFERGLTMWRSFKQDLKWLQAAYYNVREGTFYNKC